MAWLERDPSQRFHICFRFGGTKFQRSLRTSDKADANIRLSRLEENIRLVERGRLEIRPNINNASFLLSDGKLNQSNHQNANVMLTTAFDQFFGSLPESSLEESTIKCMKIHRRHLERHLGKRFKLNTLSQEKLQDYVNKRSREPGKHGDNVSGCTIKKELTTFQTLWKWEVKRKVLSVAFPNDCIRLPKDNEKPPFQTWQEIECQIARGNVSSEEQAKLWSSLFLRPEEIDSVLNYVKETASQPFVYPMFVLAAHTGARRSELIRSQLSDFDDHAVVFREKKRVRGKTSFRRVPLSTSLHNVMDDWFRIHPGGISHVLQVKLR